MEVQIEISVRLNHWKAIRGKPHDAGSDYRFERSYF